MERYFEIAHNPQPLNLEPLNSEPHIPELLNIGTSYKKKALRVKQGLFFKLIYQSRSLD
jgi:hypothetical protein